MDYGSLPIFHDITNQEVEAMIACFQMRHAHFESGRTICVYGEGRVEEELGVVVQGAVELVRLDSAGTRTILERLDPGGVFGESLAFAPVLGDCVEVVSAGDTQVLFMEYGHLMRRCEKACAHHSQLVTNMFRLLAEQARHLGRRVEVLSRRTIREKLLCYFSICALEAEKKSFPLPFTLSALADYISADRSAMMRELKKLREQGKVSVDGRQVTLHVDPESI